MSDGATDTKDRPAEAVEGEEEQGPRLPPIAYPVLALVFGAILVFSFSRILLALDKISAAAVSLFIALNILIGGALVAYGARVRRRPASFPLLVVASVAIVAVGFVAMGMERPVEHAAEGEGEGGGHGAASLQLVAKGIEWDKEQLSMPPGAEVKLELDNQDAGVPHNFSLYEDEEMTKALFTGETFNGPQSHEYTFTSPEKAGTFFFRCDVHPDTMKGTVEVAEGGGAEGGGKAVEVVAKGLAFEPKELTVSGGGEVTIRFRNEDQGIPHNVAVLEGSGGGGTPLFSGEVFNGVETREYTFEAPPPGSYTFRCDVHPDMTGTLKVT